MICEKFVFDEAKNVYLKRYAFEKYPAQMAPYHKKFLVKR